MGTISRDATNGFFDRSGAYERRVFGYTGPSSYATGGDSLTPESIALKQIAAINGMTISNGTNVYWGYYNQTSKKILWYSATATEIPNGTDLSAFTGRFEAVGK